MYIGKDRETGNYYKNNFLVRYLIEALESVMCDVMKIHLKEGLQREVGKETSRQF